MRKLWFSQDYKEKISDLQKYLDRNFGQVVRKNVMRSINQRVHMLAEHALLGVSVRDQYGVDCDYRYLYVSNSYIFYSVEKDRINVINIYNEKEDFMYILFGIKTIGWESTDYWDD